MFSAEQLAYIKIVARKQKNQGERSVSKVVRIGSEASKLIEIPGASFTLQQLGIIDYCAEECYRQHSKEMSVYDMLNAWEWADGLYTGKPESVEDGSNAITLNFIEELGKLVEPIDNKGGFRQIPIFVGNETFGYIEKAPWDKVPTLLEMLLSSYYLGLLATDAKDAENGDAHYRGWNKLSKSAEDQFYFEYENIHPFKDGNGRTGKILYNYLKGTLDNPQMPPNFYSGSNP